MKVNNKEEFDKQNIFGMGGGRPIRHLLIILSEILF